MSTLTTAHLGLGQRLSRGEPSAVGSNVEALGSNVEALASNAHRREGPSKPAPARRAD